MSSLAKAGTRLLPGRRRHRLAVVRLVGRLPPATSRIVGTRSMTWPGLCRSSPRAAMPAGQWTISGVEMPPSWTHVLCRRNGVLATRRPAGPEAQVRRRPIPAARRIVAVAADHDLGAGPVVGQEEDQRVVERVHRPDLIDDAADLAVHAIDHRRVNRHLRRLERLLLVGQFVPGQAAGSLRPGPSFLIGIGKVIRRPDFALDGGQVDR